jgi:2-hydroxychromene-2-carboxylate isomerase
VIKIQFYFDFLSPFSYFAWKNHSNLLAREDIAISYHPVLMGKLFSNFEFPGPGEIKVKRDYELKKCFRYANKNNIPFSPPASFPFNPLAINRAATVHAAKGEQIKVIDTIFDAVWGRSLILDDPELIATTLTDKNLDQDIIERAFEREAKIELKTNIKEAINSDIFGVPSFKIDDEYFWGNDSFEDLLNYIDGNDNWNKELYTNLIKEK